MESFPARGAAHSVEEVRECIRKAMSVYTDCGVSCENCGVLFLKPTQKFLYFQWFPGFPGFPGFLTKSYTREKMCIFFLRRSKGGAKETWFLKLERRRKPVEAGKPGTCQSHAWRESKLKANLPEAKAVLLPSLFNFEPFGRDPGDKIARGPTIDIERAKPVPLPGLGLDVRFEPCTGRIVKRCDLNERTALIDQEIGHVGFFLLGCRPRAPRRLPAHGGEVGLAHISAAPHKPWSIPRADSSSERRLSRSPSLALGPGLGRDPAFGTVS